MTNAQVPNVAARIKEARESAGLSQRELGLAVGHATRTVQSWEHSDRMPRFDALSAVAEATGKTVGWFYEPEKEVA